MFVFLQNLYFEILMPSMMILEHSNKGAEGKAERFPHRGLVPTSTHRPEMLVCSPSGSGGGWELRLRLQRTDPRERTGVGWVNTA